VYQIGTSEVLFGLRAGFWGLGPRKKCLYGVAKALWGSAREDRQGKSAPVLIGFVSILIAFDQIWLEKTPVWSILKYTIVYVPVRLAVAFFRREQRPDFSIDGHFSKAHPISVGGGKPAVRTRKVKAP